MKEHVTEKVEITRTRLVATCCDICGAKSKRDDWTTEIYDVAEVEIRLREGDNYPEGGSGTRIDVDMCPDCFREKLIPWLKSQGAKIEVKEWSTY